MILKGLPKTFKPFAIHLTQTDDKLTFAELRTKLRSYEDVESMRTTAFEDRGREGILAHSTRQMD